MKSGIGFLFGIILLVPNLALAQVAYDDANDAVYDNGWQTGDNGGFGWQQWNHVVSPASGVATASIGNSNSNGTLGGPGINTGGRAWQQHSDGKWIESSRNLASPGGMSAGQRMSLEFDSGSLAAGNRSQRAYFRTIAPNFFFVYSYPGISTYRIDIPSATNIDTMITVNDGGMIFSIQDNGNGTYTGKLSAKRAGNGSDFVWSGGLTSAISGFGATNNLGGPLAANDFFINSCKVEAVPEPATAIIISVGGIVQMLRKKSKDK